MRQAESFCLQTSSALHICTSTPGRSGIWKLRLPQATQQVDQGLLTLPLVCRLMVLSELERCQMPAVKKAEGNKQPCMRHHSGLLARKVEVCKRRSSTTPSRILLSLPQSSLRQTRTRIAWYDSRAVSFALCRCLAGSLWRSSAAREGRARRGRWCAATAARVKGMG